MQALSIKKYSDPYDALMRTGRPSKSARTDFGARIRSFREAVGLSQQQVANYREISQHAYALWERRNVALRSDQLIKLANVLNVTADELLGAKKPRTGGPTGKVRQVFENVSKLPRKQQLKVVEFVEAFVEKKTLH